MATQATDDKVKIQVLVIDTGKLYDGAAFNGSPTWTAVDGLDFGNDCCHPYTTSPVNDAGVDLVLENDLYIPRSGITDNTNRPDITKSGGIFTKNIDSAIKFVSSSASIAVDVYNFVTLGSQGNFYSKGIGCVFRIPYPACINSSADLVGEIYGGGGAVAWVTSTAYVRGNLVIEGSSWYVCIEGHTSGTFATDRDTNKFWVLYFPEPSTLDIQNMNRTSDGLEGFNHGTSSEDLGQINAVAFNIKISVQLLDEANKELKGQHRFRAWFADTKDNVVSQDFAVSHSNNWTDTRLPISGFRIYRGRKPLYGFDAAKAAFFPPKELEIINIFEWRNIKFFGIQWLGASQSIYDEFGRFNPVNALQEGDLVTWAVGFGAKWTMWIDSFRFIKPLLVTSGQEDTRNLEPDFLQRPNITLYDQLQNDAKSQLEIEKFKFKEFILDTSGDDIFDLPFGDSFFFENTELVDDADNGANNIKLVAKRIEYSITKPPTGKGGLKRRIQGSRIFT